MYKVEKHHVLGHLAKIAFITFHSIYILLSIQEQVVVDEMLQVLVL